MEVRVGSRTWKLEPILDDQELDLTAKEFDLLAYLVAVATPFVVCVAMAIPDVPWTLLALLALPAVSVVNSSADLPFSETESSMELFDPAGGELVTLLNGRERQRYPFADMIFSPAQLVSLISQDMTLEPGGDEEMLQPGDEIEFTQSTPGLEQLLGQVIFSATKKDGDNKADDKKPAAHANP